MNVSVTFCCEEMRKHCAENYLQLSDYCVGTRQQLVLHRFYHQHPSCGFEELEKCPFCETPTNVTVEVAKEGKCTT